MIPFSVMCVKGACARVCERERVTRNCRRRHVHGAAVDNDLTLNFDIWTVVFHPNVSPSEPVIYLKIIMFSAVSRRVKNVRRAPAWRRRVVASSSPSRGGGGRKKVLFVWGTCVHYGRTADGRIGFRTRFQNPTLLRPLDLLWKSRQDGAATRLFENLSCFRKIYNDGHTVTRVTVRPC